MDKLEDIVKAMIAAGESEENIRIVIENYKSEDLAKTEAVATETAPVTAVNQAVDTGLESGDGLLASSSDKFKNFLANQGVEPQKDITPDEFESFLDAADGISPGAKLDLKTAKYKQEIQDETKSILNNRSAQLPKTELGTINFDDKKAIEKFRKDALLDFTSSNSTIQNKIIPSIKKAIKPAVDTYVQEAMVKYKLNDPSSVTQENLDSFNKDVNFFYNELMNTKISNNTDFKALTAAFEESVDDKAADPLKSFVQSKDMPTLYQMGQTAKKIGFGAPTVVKSMVSAVNSLRGINESTKEWANNASYKQVIDKVVSFEENETRAKKYNWSDNTEGYFIEDKTNEKGSYRFKPRFTGALKSKDGVSYRDVNELVEQPKPGGAKPITWGDFKLKFKQYEKEQDEKALKAFADIQNEQFILSNYDKGELDKIFKGEDIVANSISLAAEQLPQMALAYFTLGASGALQMGGEIYTQGIDVEARKRFNLSEEDRVTLDMKKEIFKDKKFMDSLEAKSVAGGFAAGQMERFGAGKTLKPFITGLNKSLLRSGYKNFLKDATNKLVANAQNSSIEAITETGQEIITAAASGGELDAKQLFDAGATGFISSFTTGIGGNIGNQSISEAKAFSKIIAGKLNSNSSEAMFNFKIKEIEDQAKKETKANVKKDLLEKRDAIIEVRNAGLSVPKDFSSDSKSKAIDLIIKKKQLEKDIEGKEPELVTNQKEEIKKINTELQKVAADNTLEKTTKSIEKLAGDIKGVNVKSLDNAKAIDDYIEENNLDIDKKASEQQGFIFQNKETGEQTIIINKDVAAKEQAVNVAAHEFLHALLFQTVKDSPTTQVSLGNSLKSYLDKVDADQVKDSNFAKRLDQYKQDPNNVKAEEVITLFSDALATGDIKFNENVFTKIGDVIRRALQSVGVSVKFNDGKDVYNFVKDYNKSVSKGKLTKAQIEASKGVKGSLIAEGVTTASKTDTKLSKSNKELGNEIKALVPEGTSKSRYDNQVIGNVYEKLVFGKTLDGLINGQLNKYGVVGDNVYGKPKDIFLEDVKAQLYEKSLMRFNPETNDDLGGFVVNELIKYRIGDVVNRYKKEAGVEGKSLDVAAGEVGSVQEVADESMSIEDQIDLDATQARSETRLTKATKIMSKEQYDKAAKIVEEKLKNIDPKKLSYKKIGGLATDVLSEITDVPAGKILDSTKNLSKEETSRGAMFIEKNIDYIRKTLPKGAVQEAATEKLMGTATGVANSILKRLYDKNPRIKKGAGLSPWSIKPGLTNQDILDAIGRPKREDGRKFQINPRSPEGQVIKGILNLVDRNIANELARTVESDLTLEQKQDVAAGKSNLMFAKSIENATSKDFLSSKVSEKAKTSIINNISNVLVGSKTSDILMTELNDAISKRVEESKNMGQVLESMFEESERILSTRQSRELQAKLVVAVQDSFTENQNNRSLVYSAAKSIRTFFKYQREIIGYGYIKNKLKEDVSKSKTLEEKIKVIKEFLVFGSRSIRTSKIDGITTNKEIFNKIIKPLKNADKDLKGFKTFTRKNRSYITYNGKVVAGLSSIYDIKNDFANSENLINNEAETSREYIVRQIDQARSNNDIDGVIAMLAVLSSDQRGALRKSSKAGFYIEGIASDKLILEHEMEAFSIHESYVQYAKDGDIVKLKEALSEAYINSIPKYLDALLNFKGNKLSNIERYKTKKIVDELRSLNDQGRLKNFDQSRYGVKLSKSINLDKEFNDIIENKTGIESYKNYKKVKAQVTGASKGKFNFFIAPSAEDFVGLLYKTLGKGKIGDAQMAWYKENLLDPYARAMEKVSRDRNFMARSFLAIKKELKIVPKNLKKKIPGEPFTQEQAIRVYIWNKKGSTIPEISENDSIYLTNFVENNEKLKTFADQVIALSGIEDYAKPGDSWVTGTITTDMLEALNTTKRAKYLELWQQNANEIFSEKNLNKLEAAFGADYRKSMENILKRMKTGRNRAFGGDSLTGRFVDWLTGATGAIMFFNTRSAVLQTLSAVNFINFGDNNIFAAAKAFANQKQYWSDFKMLFNSEFLVERRDGLKINVNEADIADIAKEKGVRGLINKLLKLGFTPTQLADSFAIATGGATFYRNRLKALIKDGMDPAAAEKQAMRDFRETAEESQQSSRPDKISAQQAGPLGRTILAFANTPAQYARIIKKAASDIKNGRGDLKTNISKIMYYGVVQNLIFNALQQALFAALFDEDEEEIDDKTISITNGMADSILRGIGISGAIISVVKNAAMRWVKEEEKSNPKYENAILELVKISPPVSSKINKLRAAARSYSWDKDEMKEGGLSIDNPAFLAVGNVVSAVTNIPLDRVVKKIQHIKTASDSEIETYKRIFLLAGWSKWELGIKEPSKKKKKAKRSYRSTSRKSSRR